ncbi:MarR family winged helix-turn-helix transcriptional regulator [Geotalea toluenoxydans]|uniref:MarR family winged helix-turn-helix transcriptional regulator n=1 Tax=Geotalea toluenoxydans TaxID=421624 RepID=UPI000A9F0ACC|nr:MarR family transcriptional regulator [Geotalea toluenoxydans]
MPFLLDESIGFVVNQTALKLRTEMARRLKPFGLTPEQWSVLNRLAEQDGISQRELATRTFKDQPTTARILDKLMALAGTAG